MKLKLQILIFAILLGSISLSAKTRSNAPKDEYVVVFYNQENLFDTFDDPVINDEEFTPEGVKHWTMAKYQKKIANMSKVFFDLAKEVRAYPTIIGVSETENRHVLEDLVSTPNLLKANYQIVQYDSPDARGVDCALFYRPDKFKLLWSKPIKTIIPSRPDFRTRDILAVCGTIDNELFCFFVNHWSSRWGGSEQSSFLREGAATTLKHFADSLQIAQPGIKMVMMGDLNDDPQDKSVHEVLGAKEEPKMVGKNGYFNPFFNILKAGFGSLGYQDAWNLFDNIIVNANLLNAPKGSIALKQNKTDKYHFYGYIFKRKYMIQQEGRYKNYPFRTFSGNTFQNGYSDHLPVYIKIGK